MRDNLQYQWIDDQGCTPELKEENRFFTGTVAGLRRRKLTIEIVSISNFSLLASMLIPILSLSSHINCALNYLIASIAYYLTYTIYIHHGG